MIPSAIKSLTLYHYPLSRSMRVKWMLHELVEAGAIDGFETVRVDMLKGEGMAPKFLAKNPNHAVPVLDIEFADGRVKTMIESAAMLQWLAEVYPEARLAPDVSDIAARADYHQMLTFGGAWVDLMLWNLRLHKDLFPKPMRHQVTIDFWSAKLENEVVPQLTSRLKTAEYIAGDNFTAADIMTGHNLLWAAKYGLCRHEDLAPYMKRLRARPAFKLAYADKDEFER